MSCKKLDKDAGEINLRTLRRMDKNIVNIVKSASAVAVYKFSSEKNAWDKREIEGSLHVVSRGFPPHTCFFVINRLNTNNLSEPITKDTDIKIETPFLLFKSSHNEILCIWFYEEEECIDIGEFLIAKLSSLSGNNIPPSPATASLVDKLAQLGITNITVTKSSNSATATNDNLTPNLTPNQTPNITPVVNHSAKSGMNKLNENGGRSLNLQDLFANVSMAQGNSSTRSNFGPVSLFNKLESVGLSMDENKDNLDNKERSSSPCDEMLTPAMIDEKAKLKAQEEKKVPISPINLVPQFNEAVLKQSPNSAFITPRSGITSTPNHKTNNHYSIAEPLSIEQLKTCLIHLIQNDDDFIQKIHKAYLSSSLFHN